jgi:CDP-4-dehydro-6-deoxyglucose reductase/ferredoxin-NAD(P)+ reductase (naphthalene dioxygenase ferredoxin-specific)
MRIIMIEQLGVPLRSGKGTILDAALAAGIAFPHSCRVGECGACKSRLIAGEVSSPVPADPAVLSPSERAAGVILPCRSWPKTDVTLAWLADVDPSEAAPIRRMTTRVVGLEDSTHDIKRVRLELDGPPLVFTAGQYAQLQFGEPAR